MVGVTCGWAGSCFFFNDTATTEIYTLSLHDALPISTSSALYVVRPTVSPLAASTTWTTAPEPESFTVSTTSPSTTSPLDSSDRKSTRLNSSHANISYAVFCLNKKYDASMLFKHNVLC